MAEHVYLYEVPHESHQFGRCMSQNCVPMPSRMSVAQEADSTVCMTYKALTIVEIYTVCGTVDTFP